MTSGSSARFRAVRPVLPWHRETEIVPKDPRPWEEDAVSSRELSDRSRAMQARHPNNLQIYLNTEVKVGCAECSPVM